MGYIYSVDPGLRNIGVAVSTTKGQVVYVDSLSFDPKNYPNYQIIFSSIREAFGSLFSKWSPCLLLIEQIDFRHQRFSSIQRSVAETFASSAVILSLLPNDVESEYINKIKFRKELGLLQENLDVKKATINRYKKFLGNIKKSSQSHAADALAILDFYFLRKNIKIRKAKNASF